MKSDTIYVAEHEGVNVIRMVGDVRLTLCLSFDAFIDHILSQKNFKSVVFDLTQARAIDSTTLGLMAKIAILGQRKQHPKPLVISSDTGITRLLVSMGFEDIFHIVDHADMHVQADIPLAANIEEEQAIKNTILNAHKTLSEMNDLNEQTFKELINTLETYQ